jgi:hypothetical protein
VAELTAELLVGRLDPREVAVLPDGREALVTAPVEADPGPLMALLEVMALPGEE